MTTSKKLKKYYGKYKELLLSEDYITEELLNSGAIRYALAIKNLYRNQAINIIQTISMSTATKDYLKKIMK